MKKLLSFIFLLGLCPSLFAAVQTISDPWVDGEVPTASKWNSHESIFLAGINNVESDQIVDGTITNSDINASAAIVASKLNLSTVAQPITLDDGIADSPVFTFKDATDETVTFQKTDGDYLFINTLADEGVNITTGNFAVGNGTPGLALNGEDAYIEGTLEVDGAAQFDGTVTFNGTVSGISTPVVALGSVSGTQTLEAEKVYTAALTGETTIALPTPTSGILRTVIFEFTMASAQTVNVPVSVTWNFGVTPSLATGTTKNRYTFDTIDGGTTWKGFYTQF